MSIEEFVTDDPEEIGRPTWMKPQPSVGGEAISGSLTERVESGDV